MSARVKDGRQDADTIGEDGEVLDPTGSDAEVPSARTATADGAGSAGAGSAGAGSAGAGPEESSEPGPTGGEPAEAEPAGPEPAGPEPAEVASRAAEPREDPPAAAAAAAPASPPPSRPRRSWAATLTDPARREGHARALVVATAALGLAALSVLTFSATAGAGASSTPAPAAVTTELVGPALLTGRVTEVTDPGTVRVEVQGQQVPVSVVGADFSTTPPCAAGPALDFARVTLAGQRVTLVPDPTLPEPPVADPSAARRAYLVLPTQLSYTDAAITAGWATPGEGQYRAVFDQELKQAQDERAGMWGPPCRRRP